MHVQTDVQHVIVITVSGLARSEVSVNMLC